MRREVRFAIATMVLAFAGCAATPPLREDARGLESPNADVRRESANALRATRVPDPELHRQLVRKLAVMAQSDPEPLVRSAALMALTRQDAATAVDLARRLRTDPDTMVRWDAVKVMAASGGPELVPAFIEVAGNDASEDVRREATRALGAYGEPRVIDALVLRLNDEGPSVRHAARMSLARIAGVDLGPAPDAWRKWWTQKTSPPDEHPAGDTAPKPAS
jgi:HEAT repeat protein